MSMSIMRFDIVSPSQSASVETTALALQETRAHHARAVQPKACRGAEHAESILHGSTKRDGRRLVEVLGRAGDLGDLKAEVHGLHEHLVVEHEVVVVLLERQREQQLS